jgi:putative flippase GtrA
LPELIRFCVVGGLGSVVDLGGAALLHGKYHVEPLAAKAISTSAATVLTYLGSRFWTFKHRENQELKREAVLFIVLNLAGLLIAEVVVGFVTYVMGQHGQLQYNIASFLGTGLATIFRYFAYKKWVFLAPGKEPEATKVSAAGAFPDYPPWELDPAFLVQAEATAGAPEKATNSDQTMTVSWEALTPRTTPLPVAADPFPVAGAPASHFPVPGLDAAAPAPPAVPAAASSSRSSGGRHRKNLGGAASAGRGLS